MSHYNVYTYAVYEVMYTAWIRWKSELSSILCLWVCSLVLRFLVGFATFQELWTYFNVLALKIPLKVLHERKKDIWSYFGFYQIYKINYKKKLPVSLKHNDFAFLRCEITIWKLAFSTFFFTLRCSRSCDAKTQFSSAIMKTPWMSIHSVKYFLCVKPEELLMRWINNWIILLILEDSKIKWRQACVIGSKVLLFFIRLFPSNIIYRATTLNSSLRTMIWSEGLCFSRVKPRFFTTLEIRTVL